MLNNKTLLTPIALAAAMAAGAAHAAEPVDGRLAGAVSRVADALTLDGLRNGGNVGDTGTSGLSLRSADRDRDLGEAFDADRNGGRGSLSGLAAADRATLFGNDGDERRTYDPQGINLDLSLGNAGDSPEARAPGLRVSHDSTLHLRTEEDPDSPIDNGDETARSGLDSNTSVHLVGSRENDDGDRERVARGIESGVNVFNHAPHDDSDAESYRTAEVSTFAVERRVEEGVIGDDEDSERRGGALRYDSREGFSFEGGNEDDDTF